MTQTIIKYTRPDGFSFEGDSQTLINSQALTPQENERIANGVSFFATSEIQPSPIHFSEDGALLEFLMNMGEEYMSEEEAEAYYEDYADGMHDYTTGLI